MQIRKKERFYIITKFNSHRNGLAHQHGGHDVMWKQPNCPTIQFLIVVFEAAPKTLKNVWKKWWMPSFPGNFSTCWEGQNPTSKNLIMSVNMFHVDPMARLHRALLHILGCRSEAFCFPWWKIILYACLLIKDWVTLSLAGSSMDQY